MRITSLHLRLTGAAVATALALSACGAGSDSNGAPKPSADNPAGVLKVGLTDSVSNLLPGVEAGQVNYWIAAIETEGLVTLGADGSLQPALATSWKRTDTTTYVYEIDPKARFQDGSPVTMKDILASIAAARDKKVSPAESYLWSSVKRVRQTGAWEVTITLSQPDASFQYTPSSSAGLWVYPASYWKSAGAKVGTATALPIGTGPYRFTRFDPDSGVTLTRSKYWTGAKPAFDSVQFQIIPDASSEKLALENGDIDMTLPVPVSQYAQWEKSSSIDTTFTPNRSIITMDFDTSVKPFDDQHVRNAIAYSFDRQAFVSRVLDGHGRVATSLLMPEQFGGVASVDDATAQLAGLPQYGFDPDKAKAELAASSVPHGFSFTVQVPDAFPELKSASLLLQQNLAQIGVTMKIATGTSQDWYGTIGDGKHGLGWMLYTTVSADPGELSDWFLAPGNPAKVSDPQIDAQMAKARAATDLHSRIDALVAANRIQNQKNYYAPISWGELAIASRGLKLDDFSSYTLTTPWVQQVEPDSN